MPSRGEHLPEFHHIISEQLNARLAESPKFFWVLVIVSSGYGYVLANHSLRSDPLIFHLTAGLAYISVLWASWYLAALGYAFRFLQNGQHCIERALGWHSYVPKPGRPPCGYSFKKPFWLLPGIYHAHAYGLMGYLILISAAFVKASCSPRAGLIGLIACVGGLVFVVGANLYYRRKFWKRRKDPSAFFPL